MTDPGTASRYRRPDSANIPDLATISEQAAFDAMSQTSLEDVTASAERWRTGLAGLTTLVTGGLLLKGPANAADLDLMWRVVLTVLFGLGIVASVAGLLFALRAAAGAPSGIRFETMRRDYGSVRLYRLDLAARAADNLRLARRAALTAAVLLAAAVLSWWWAPPNPGATVTVTAGSVQSCGVIVDSDAAGLRLAVKDTPTRVTVPWTGITSIKNTASC
jgi:hypothetical protein